MKLFLHIFLLLSLFSLISCVSLSKVDPTLLFLKGDAVDIVILLKDQINIHELSKKALSSDEKASIIFDSLVELSKKSQERLISFLLQHSITNFQSFYITNSVFVDRFPVKLLKSLISYFSGEEIAMIFVNQPFRVPLDTPPELPIQSPFPLKDSDYKQIPESIKKIYHNDEYSDEKFEAEWNIRQIKADQLHARGITGKGILVANADTGFKWDHPNLIRNYNGYRENGSHIHDYSWFDALHDEIDDPPNLCGYSVPKPVFLQSLVIIHQYMLF